MNSLHLEGKERKKEKKEKLRKGERHTASYDDALGPFGRPRNLWSSILPILLGNVEIQT